LGFFRRFGVDGEGVYARAKFVGKDFVHAALARNAVHAGKGARNDAHPEMRFALRSRARVSGMSPAFIDDIEINRRQGFGELSSNLIGYAHRLPLHAQRGCQALRFLVFSFSPPIILAWVQHTIGRASARTSALNRMRLRARLQPNLVQKADARARAHFAFHVPASD
jgi:hypothetical protein